MAYPMTKVAGKQCAKVRRRAVPAEAVSPKPIAPAAPPAPAITPADTAKLPASPLSPPVHAPTTVNGAKVNKLLNGHEAAPPAATPSHAQPAPAPQPPQPAPAPPAAAKTPAADAPAADAPAAQPQAAPPANPPSQVRGSKGGYAEVIARPLVAHDQPVIEEEQHGGSAAAGSSSRHVTASSRHPSSSPHPPLVLTSHPPTQNPPPAAIPAAAPQAQNPPAQPETPQQKSGGNSNEGVARGAPAVAGGQPQAGGNQGAPSNSNGSPNNAAQGASPAGSASPAQGSQGLAVPLMQSAGVNEPNDRSGPGSGGDSLVAVPVTITSKGVVQTSTYMVSPSGSIATKGKGPNGGNTKNGQTNAANSGTGMDTAQLESEASKPSGGPVIAGVISGIVVLSILCGLAFFCLRKRRRNRDSVASFQAGRPSSNVATSIRGYFAISKFQSQNSATTARSPSPYLETGLSRPSMSAMDPPRIRSQSEPARRPYAAAQSTFANRQATNGSPTLPELRDPIIPEVDNPFLDPESEPPRRPAPPATRRPRVTPPPPPPYGTSPPVPARSPSRLYPRQTPPSAAHNRPLDPFADPFADGDEEGARQSFPASDGSRYSEASPGGARHSRSRTMANVPIITHTAPSIASSHRAGGSDDSRNGSPALAAGQFGGLGLGIRRSGSGASQGSSLYPTPLRSAARPANRQQQQQQQQQRMPEPALLSAANGPGGGRYKRLSNVSASSNGSSSLSIEFPSSWGEPGPTRPGSMVSGGEPAAAAAAAATSAPRAGASRVSDPFDLDVPELLSYAESHYSSSSSLAPAQGNGNGGRAPPTITTLADEHSNRRR